MAFWDWFSSVFIQFWAQLNGMVSLTFRMGLPTLTNLIYIIPYRYVRIFVSKMILYLVRLTDKPLQRIRDGKYCCGSGILSYGNDMAFEIMNLQAVVLPSQVLNKIGPAQKNSSINSVYGFWTLTEDWEAISS